MRGWGARRLLVVAVATLALGAGLAVVPHPVHAATCTNAFSPAFAQDLARRHPGIKVTAAVYDTRTGCWHHLHHGLQLTTASVIKAQVLGAVLVRAQDAGRGLTSWERSQIGPMIQYSFNPETSNLYAHVGYEGGMYASDPRFGVTSTTHTATFGLTRSDAVDRTHVALKLLYGGGALAQPGRDEAWGYLSNVHPLQEWGISAGVPAGWTVAQKNGFYPASGLGWRVGSSGFVRQEHADHGYAITVMTEGASNQRTGILLVEEVARRAASALTVGPGQNRPIDRARCVLTNSGESWSGVAARLGLPSGRAGEVRTTSGGNASPLAGQQACSPDIPPEPVASTSTINGHYRPAATDLDCNGADDLLWFAPGGAADTRWAGHRDRRFHPRSMSMGGDAIPVAGDFNGDGCGDVLWYGPGTRADSVSSGGGSVTSTAISVLGHGYVPRAGDFDGDGRDDVLWHRPGSGADSVWYGRATPGAFDAVGVTVDGAFDPVVGDLDGDGADDVLWYAPGPGSDPIWRGTVGARRFSGGTSVVVDGAFRPVVADHDGDGDDEITWYAPGGAPDRRWSGLPPAHTSTALDIAGDYLPLAGDFDGDGRGDIAWYGLGGKAESIWWGRADGGVTPGALQRV